jgi:MFS family permease
MAGTRQRRLSAAGSGLTLPFLLVYLHQVRGISYGLAGLAVAALALAAIFGKLLGGALTDRFGARQALIGGLVVSAAGPLAMAYAQSPWQAFAAAGSARASRSWWHGRALVQPPPSITTGDHGVTAASCSPGGTQAPAACRRRHRAG